MLTEDATLPPRLFDKQWIKAPAHCAELRRKKFIYFAIVQDFRSRPPDNEIQKFLFSTDTYYLVLANSHHAPQLKTETNLAT